MCEYQYQRCLNSRNLYLRMLQSPDGKLHGEAFIKEDIGYLALAILLDLPIFWESWEPQFLYQKPNYPNTNQTITTNKQI